MVPCAIEDCGLHEVLKGLLEKPQNEVAAQIPADCRICEMFTGFHMYRSREAMQAPKKGGMIWDGLSESRGR